MDTADQQWEKGDKLNFPWPSISVTNTEPLAGSRECLWHSSVSALQKGSTSANGLGRVGFSEGWKIRQGILISAEHETYRRSMRTACCTVTTVHSVQRIYLMARPGQMSSQGRRGQNYKDASSISSTALEPMAQALHISEAMSLWYPASNHLTGHFLSATAALCQHAILQRTGRRKPLSACLKLLNT